MGQSMYIRTERGTRMSMEREAPPDHVSVQDAGERLGVNPETVRNWLRSDPQKIAGQVVENAATNRREYWVQVRGEAEYPTLEEVAAQRGELATRGEIDLAEQRVLGFLEGIRDRIDRQRIEVTGQIERQRLEVTSNQREMLSQLKDISESLAREAAAKEEQAEAQDRMTRELSALNRYLEEGARAAEGDRAALAILLRTLRDQGAFSRETPEPREPWYKRWFT
jgi:hypothetical protein